jgi:uncharacterized protein YqeY
MEDLKRKINSDYIVAFKAKDTITKNLLSVIKGEIQNAEKNTGTDNLGNDVVLKILNKTLKGLKESQRISYSLIIEKELLIIESYLPVQMTKEEITRKITELMSSGANTIGEIMKEFSSLRADKKEVSQIYQSLQ